MHAFYLREAWRSFAHHRGLTATAIVSLTAALSVIGVFLVLVHNANVGLRSVGDRREMVAYLKDEVSRAQRDTLIQRLQTLYGDVTYVSREQAWQDFSEQLGSADLLEAVDANPLPASLRIRLKPELLNYGAMETTANQIRQFQEVEDVRFGGEWVKRLDDVGRALRHGALGVGLAVAFGILVVLYNTIRLTVFARRPQVEIMSRLGASEGFITTPFVIEAMMHAAAAALLALAATFAFHRAFVAQVVPIAFLPLSWLALFLAATLALAFLASILALSRAMRSVGA